MRTPDLMQSIILYLLSINQIDALLSCLKEKSERDDELNKKVNIGNIAKKIRDPLSLSIPIRSV